MKLFDEIPNGRYEVASFTEPQFTFLNRTPKEEFAKIRDLLEGWFERYPIPEQSEFRSRFRSLNNYHHQAAFFELFLHELLFQLDCKPQLHPSLNKTTKTPDFLVAPLERQSFYLEATLVSGETARETTARARENVVYDVLNRLVKSPDYFLSLSVRGSPESPPPAKQLANYINRELAVLDYDHIERLFRLNGDRNMPTWHFNHDGWVIEIQPIPKGQLRGNRSIRPIGTIKSEIKAVTPWGPIHDAIIEKGGKYGTIDFPYVIALNAIEQIDTLDIMQALFGEEEILISENFETRMRLKPNGAWFGPKGPQYTRVSAALVITQLSPYNIPRAKLTLYHNPWAKNPYTSVLTQLPQAIQIDGRIQWVDGKKPTDIFKLPSTWPDNVGNEHSTYHLR